MNTFKRKRAERIAKAANKETKEAVIAVETPAAPVVKSGPTPAEIKKQKRLEAAREVAEKEKAATETKATKAAEAAAVVEPAPEVPSDVSFTTD